MNDLVSYLLDGLEAALELERELGVRSVEIDRETRDSWLAVGRSRSAVGGNGGTGEPRATSHEPRPTSHELANRRIGEWANGGNANQEPRTASHEPRAANHALVFLHDRPLSPAGAEMMSKILTALQYPTAPIVVAPPVPKARVVVVLGGRAMKLYYPEMKGEPGQWLKSPTGGDVLVTYSPEYILRFGTVTPAVQKLKQDMWRSLKAVQQRLR